MLTRRPEHARQRPEELVVLTRIIANEPPGQDVGIDGAGPAVQLTHLYHCEL